MPLLARVLGLIALLAAVPAYGRDGLDQLPNLVRNGSFENGAQGWRPTIGPWARRTGAWPQARGIADVAGSGAFAGSRCLRLDARRQPDEIDVSSDQVAVEAGKAYLLSSRVRQLAGDGSYKVVLDWSDAAGGHLAYSNDWRGVDRPRAYAFHGGVFVAPPRAARVIVLLGVAKGVACLFDDIRLSVLPAVPGGPVPDGEGAVDTQVPRSVRAGSFATFRIVYRAGPHGLPPGAAVEFRRSNVNPRWSVPQASEPRAPGYVTATASNGALCIVQPGGAGQVPCVTRVSVVYPALAPGDTLTMTYGATSGGSPGARVQPTCEQGIRLLVGMDGDADGRALDLPDPPAFDVTPGPFARLGLVAPAVAEAGRPFKVTVEARDSLGNQLSGFAGPVTVRGTLPGETGSAAAPSSDGSGTAAVHDGGRAAMLVALRRPGLGVLRASCQGVATERTVLVSAAAPAIPTLADPGARAVRIGGAVALQNGRVRLVFPRNGFGYGVAFLDARGPAGWQRAGVFRSLGELRVGARGEGSRAVPLWLGSARLYQRAAAAQVTFTGSVLADGVAWSASVVCSLGAAAQHVAIRCTVTPQGRAHLRAFYAPVMLAGDGAYGSAKSGALFPGLEYLTADEHSSGDYGSVPPLSERSVPHPFKVTMPLMAVAGEGTCAMLFWDPLQKWDASHACPAARFESPARDDGGNHLLGLLAPTPWQGLPENAAEMPAPLVVQPGKRLTLEVSAAALAPAPDVTAAVRYWFAVHGVPAPPPAPRSTDDELAMVATALSQSAWDAGKSGWHSALADPWGAGYSPDAALLLWYYGQTHPRSPLRAGIDRVLADAWKAAGSRAGFDMAFHLGDAAAALSGLQASGEAAIYAMTPDGAYAYHPHRGNATFTQANARSLGRDGEINVGTCAMGLEPLWRAAYLTGDPFLVEYGEKGLAYLDRFRRPQGAENWEVPLACPNLRAAALALRCYLYGYLVTGKERYLDQARYWAYTGLPFIYVWNAPDRPIMRYCSISVMGTSLYTGGWFGNAVQWVGLVYTEAIRELAPYDRGFPWATVADGICVSAAQQQKTAGAPCGHVGMYPDSYSPVKGDETYHWCLSPQAIGYLAYALHGLDARAGAAVVRVGDRSVHVAASGRIAATSYADGTLRFDAQDLPGLPHEIVVARVAKAEQVLVDGAVLAPSDLRGDADLGWQATPYGYLRLRVSSPSGLVHVEVRGCTLMAPGVVRSLTEITNGDFEAGLLGWVPNPPTSVRVTSDAHGGTKALELDATGSATEVQCGSGAVRVEPGKTYELSAWVKAHAGSGDYKVTIDWSSADTHLAYSNDWQGTNRPARFTLHGGRFVAPPGAQRASIILGARAGSCYLFDDVALKEVR